MCDGLDHNYYIFSFSVEPALRKESTVENRCYAAQ